MTPSPRRRLLLGLITGSVISFAAFSLGVYLVIRSALFSQLDASLASTAQILAASIEIDGNEIELEFEVARMPEFQNADKPTYYQLWKSQGSVVAKSPLLDANDLGRLEGAVGELVFSQSQIPDNMPLRAVGLKFHPRSADSEDEPHPHVTAGQALTLAVARDATDLLAQLEFLRWLLISAAVTVTILSVVIAAIVVREGLEPLNVIASEIAAIDQQNLAERIEAVGAPREVVPIRDTLNDLLVRLEEAFKRERRFTADVAHELRTPLAGLRSTIEVTLSRQRENPEYRGALGDSLSIVASMNTMVNNLLMLARLDARQVTLASEDMNLAELVDNAWRPFADKALESEIVFENNIPADSTCQSDREHLSMVLSNLLENAAEYTNQAGKITASAEREGNSLKIIVSNTGCRLTAEQLPKIFDSFWRADLSRTEAAAHAGLGLALVKRITEALNGRVTANIDQGDTFKITLRLP